MHQRFKVQRSDPVRAVRGEGCQMAYDLLGKNFVPPDIRGKVTGKAKYAEDFRAEGMVFCRLLLSPMPHARVRSVDTKEAEALPGVLGILRAAEVPQQPAP